MSETPKGAKSPTKSETMSIEYLAGKVDALEGAVNTLLEKVAQSPFVGYTPEDVATMVAFVIGTLQPGGVLDYQVKQRAVHALRGLEAMRTGNDELLQDKPRVRSKVEAGATTTRFQGDTSSGEREVPSIQMAGIAAPPRNPNR